MVINSNVAAQTAATNLNNSSNMLNASLARLSSGSNFVNPAYDPAGNAESISLNAQISQTSAANGNVGNAISYLQTQNGYLQQVGSALDQMATLAIQAQDVTKSASQRTDYQSEYSTLAGYITDTATKDFNGVSLFAGAALAVTTDSSGTKFNTTGVNLGASQYTGATAGNVSTTTGAVSALTAVTSAITQLGTDTAKVGADTMRLTYTSSELNVLKDNLNAANSQIANVDVATESTKYAAAQILVQAGVSMLAQANQNPQAVLKLIQ